MSFVIPNSIVFKSSRHTALFLLIELYHVIQNKIKKDETHEGLGSHISKELELILSDLINQNPEHIKSLDYKSNSPEVIRFIKFYLEFNHIAERFHRISLSKEKHVVPKLMSEFEELRPGIDIPTFVEFMDCLEIDLVFTAHPTEIFERKILKKYIQLHKNLKKLLISQNFNLDSNLTVERKSVLLSLWLSPDYGTQRPTPKDEAKLGQLIYQYSLWDGLTHFKKRFYTFLKKNDLPLETNINFLKFSSWMGSDRDGNPNVTANVTESVVKSFAKKSLNLYYRDFKRLKEDLCFEITVNESKHSLENSIGLILKKISDIIKNDYSFIEIRKADLEILNELKTIYSQLVDFNAKFLADRRLRSLIDRLESFGLLGMRWDIRQESGVHDFVVEDIFKINFSTMEENDRLFWIQNKFKKEDLDVFFKDLDPLKDGFLGLNSQTIDFINTLKLIKKLEFNTFPYYVISMTRSASDLLLIQRFLEYLDVWTQVVPLFETLEDLTNSPEIMNQFLKLKKLSLKMIPIMLGYSDSAKSGSRLSSVWHLYLAQKQLATICKQYGLTAEFFHGRGGSIGRGGGPVQHAVASCPRESVQHGFRMTIQGEVIFDRFGFAPIAVQTMMTYAMSLINYNFSSKKNPQELRGYESIFSEISDQSKIKYLDLLNQKNFLDYFEAVTPVDYLSDLNIGSRPSKRKAEKKSYRAIPWIFGWTQNRCLLPSWFGAGTALEYAVNKYGVKKLSDLYQNFFLFRSTLDLVYMTYLKVDMNIFKNYDKKLWAQQDFYTDIETEYNKLKKYLLMIVDPQKINHVNLEEKLYGRLEVLEYLNKIQIELIKKHKQNPKEFNDEDKKLLLLTIQSLASGMGNTG